MGPRLRGWPHQNDLKIRTNIDDNYEIHSTSSKSIEKSRLNQLAAHVSNHLNPNVYDEEEAVNKFLNTYDKEYSVFFERIDRLRKSSSRDRIGLHNSSVDNKRA